MEDRNMESTIRIELENGILSIPVAAHEDTRNRLTSFGDYLITAMQRYPELGAKMRSLGVTWEGRR